MGMLHIIRIPHPEHVVPLTFTVNPRDWRVSQCQWICYHFCSSRMRWEGLKSWIQAVFTTVYSLKFSLLLFYLEKRGDVCLEQWTLPSQSNPVTCTGTRSALRPHGRKGGRGRDGSSQLPEHMQLTALPWQCVHFFPVKISYLSQLNWEARTNLAHVQGTFLVTIPNEVSSLVGGLPDTPTTRTVGSLLYLGMGCLGLPYNNQQRAEQGEEAHHDLLLPALAVRQSPPRNKGHVRNDLGFCSLSGDISLCCHL